MNSNSSNYKYKTFEETISKPIKCYTVTDYLGKKVTISPKNPAKHKSSHPLEQHPTVFHNLGLVLSNPDKVEESKSKDPTSKKNCEKGKVLLYHKKGYIQSLDFPHITEGNDKMIVVVLYENPAKNLNPKNYTLSYRISYDLDE